MEDRLTRTRSKADFRLLRDMVGVSQMWVAKRLGVTKQTVLNWENPKEFYPPRREAWDLMEGLWREADEKASAMVDLAVSAAGIARERGIEPAPMTLSYYRSIEDYVRAGHGEDEGMWRVENAAVRLAADRLRVLGVPAGVVYVEPMP